MLSQMLMVSCFAVMVIVALWALLKGKYYPLEEPVRVLCIAVCCLMVAIPIAACVALLYCCFAIGLAADWSRSKGYVSEGVEAIQKQHQASVSVSK